MDYSIPLWFRYTYERAIYMVNYFQFTRSARLSTGARITAQRQYIGRHENVKLFLRGPLAWYSKERRDRKENLLISACKQ